MHSPRARRAELDVHNVRAGKIPYRLDIIKAIG